MRRGILIAVAAACLVWAMPANAAELLRDGSFESSTGTPGNSPFWTETDTVFGSPLCTVAGCTNGDGTAGPRTGLWWSWFGGAQDGAAQAGSVSQGVIIPRGTASLSFFLWIGTGTAGDGDELVTATIDSTPVFSATPNTSGFGAYAPVTRNVSAFANGRAHTLTFAFSNPTPNADDQVVNMAVDDVSLLATPAKKCKKKKGKKGAAAAKKKCKKKKKK